MSLRTSLRCRIAGRRACAIVVMLAVPLPPTGMSSGRTEPSRPAPAAPARRTVVDPAVVPAGGCRGCNAPACRACHGRHAGHHAGCRDGNCHPHCPVKPQEFGFYGTQWRRWPAADIVPVANEQAVTPAVPPRSQVPRSDEESRRSRELPEELEPATAPAATRESEAGNALPRRTPKPPEGDEDPALPPAPPSGPEPDLLPQSLRGDDRRQVHLPNRPSGKRTTAPPRVVALPPGLRPAVSSFMGTGEPPAAVFVGDDAPLPLVPDEVPPEPAPEHEVVSTVAAAEQAADEAALGPSRRRFVAQRPVATRPAAGAADRRAAP